MLSPANQFNYGPSGLSPLVLDLDGDGVEVTRLGFGESAATTYFDMDNDGFAERTAWATGGDGLLVIDLNSNGTIDNHGELFGHSYVFADGFANLATYDSNSSGTITSADAQWASLKVWIDADEDGVTDTGELHTLSSLGITSFDLSATPLTNTSLNENKVTATSTFTMGGVAHTVSDVWFSVDQYDSRYQGDVELDVRTLFLPTLKGFGDLKDLHVAMSEDEDLLDLVQQFVLDWNTERFGDAADLNDAVQEILFKWAGTETATIVTYSYSYGGPAPYDTREFSFMEKITGKAYPASFYDPNEPAVFDILHNSYVTLRESLKAHLVLQAGGGDLFETAPVYDIASGNITGGELDLSVLGDLSTEASASPDAHAYWMSVVSFLIEMKEAAAYTSTEIAALNTAIQTSDPLLSWASLVADVYNLNGGIRLEDWRINYTEDFHSVHLVGTNGGDEINGGLHHDWLVGRDGDDLMRGLAGNDRIEGGAGNDTIYANEGDDMVVYDYGLDTLYDYGGTDTIEITVPGKTASDISVVRTSTYQYSLDVFLSGVHILTIESQFNDLGGYEIITFADETSFDLSAVQYTTTGTSGADTLHGIASGGDPDDIINGLGGADTIYAYTGNDTINAGAGLDTVDGGLGNDVYKIDYNSGKDTITDDGGVDKVLFGSGYSSTNLVLSRSGSDLNLVMSGTVVATFVSHFDYTQFRLLETVEFYNGAILDVSSAVFTQSGTSGVDTLQGHNGRDTLNGNDGSDYLNGYGGTDTVNGGNGDDLIWGGAGNDSLYGGNNNDTIYAEDGDDLLDGGSGNDTMYGGAGNDTYVVGSTSDVVYEASGEGIDTVQTSTTLTLASEVENLTLAGTGAISGTGNTLDNVMLGNSGNNTLSGGDGNDTLTGSGGNDTLYGQDGIDLLFADAGLDNLYGGAGADTFRFKTASLDGNIDRIKDFSLSDSDVLNIAEILVGYDPLTKVITDYIELTTSGSNTIMKIDRDGLGTTYSLTQVAQLDAVTGLTDEATLLSQGRIVAV